METRAQKLVAQIDSLLLKFPSVKESWHSSSMGGRFQATVAYESLITESHTLISHVYGPRHPNVQRTLNAITEGSLHALQQIEGILDGTRHNLEAGLLENVTS